MQKELENENGDDRKITAPNNLSFRGVRSTNHENAVEQGTCGSRARQMINLVYGDIVEVARIGGVSALGSWVVFGRFFGSNYLQVAYFGSYLPLPKLPKQ